MSEGVRLGRARNAGIQDRRSLLFMNYIHARLFKRSLLVLSVNVAFTLLLPWIRRQARGLLPFYANLVQLHTFTVLRQNALTFTLPPPYGMRRAGWCPLSAFIVGVPDIDLALREWKTPSVATH